MAIVDRPAGWGKVLRTFYLAEEGRPSRHFSGKACHAGDYRAREGYGSPLGTVPATLIFTIRFGPMRQMVDTMCGGYDGFAYDRRDREAGVID